MDLTVQRFGVILIPLGFQRPAVIAAFKTGLRCLDAEDRFQKLRLQPVFGILYAIQFDSLSVKPSLSVTFQTMKTDFQNDHTTRLTLDIKHILSFRPLL